MITFSSADFSTPSDSRICEQQLFEFCPIFDKSEGEGRLCVCSGVCKTGFTLEREQNANAAFENDANVWCWCVTEARQTAFGCATNVRQTAECYSSTVGTSKGIRIQYLYVGLICCLVECQTIYRFTHINICIVFACCIRVPM